MSESAPRGRELGWGDAAAVQARSGCGLGCPSLQSRRDSEAREQTAEQTDWGYDSDQPEHRAAMAARHAAMSVRAPWLELRPR